MGFCECDQLRAPVGRTRADTQRADTQRSTTTHGRSRRGGAGGTRRARAEQTEGRDFSTGLLEGTFQTCCNLFKSKGLRISSSNASILIHNDGRWLAGAAAAARARWRRRRSARRLPRGAGRASRGARAGLGNDSHADRMLSPVVVTVSAASIVVMLFRHVDAPNYIGLLRRTCPRRSAMSAGTPRPHACVAEWSPPAWRSSRSSWRRVGCGGA